MDDHPNEHEAEPETGATTDAVASEALTPSVAVEPPTPMTAGESDGPATPEGWATPVAAAATAESGGPAADPWVLFVRDQDVRAKAISKRRTKRILIASAAAVVIIAAGVGGVIASRHSDAPGSGMAPAAFVVSSTQTTLNQRTADVTYSGTVSCGRPERPAQRHRAGRLRHQHLQRNPERERLVDHYRRSRTDRVGPVLHGHDDRRSGHVPVHGWRPLGRPLAPRPGQRWQPRRSERRPDRSVEGPRAEGGDCHVARHEEHRRHHRLGVLGDADPPGNRQRDSAGDPAEQDHGRHRSADGAGRGICWVRSPPRYG